MKNIIITGATSFVGINLIKELIRREVKIYTIVRPDSPKIKLIPRSSKVVLVQMNMANYNNLSSYIQETCDCFIHLAWNGTRGNDRMNRTLQIENYNYAMETVHSAIQLKCKTIISAGSQAEYGTHNYPITENTPCKPDTEYGEKKLEFCNNAAKLCKGKGVHFIEPRFFSLYGPGDYEGTMVISTLRKMLKNEDCEFTKAVQMWDYLYITDAVKGLIKLIFTDSADGVYNLGNGVSRPLKAFIEEMHQLTYSKSKLLFGAIPYPKTGVVGIEPIIDKLKNETGWFPETSFQAGILNILKSMKCEGQK